MKSQSYRLGIDIGTSSIAVAAFSLDPLSGQPERLMAIDGYIFGEPVDSDGFTLSNANRRAKRLARRQLERKKARIAQLLHLGRLIGLDSAALRKAHLETGNNLGVWALRAKALDQRVSLADLWLIALRISKNRGYKGNVPTSTKSVVAKGIHGLAELKGSYRTLAEGLVKRPNLSGQSRFRKLVTEKSDGSTISGTFQLRSDIEAEMDLILQQQRQHHPELNAGLDSFGPSGRDLVRPGSNYFHGLIPQNLGEALRRVLFYQRPLPSYAATIGKCSLVPSEVRVGTAHPAFQDFRVEKLISDSRWKIKRTTLALTAAQRQILRVLLLQYPQVTFQHFYEALEDHDCAKPKLARLNFHTSRTTALKGHQTLAAMRSLRLHEAWEGLTVSEQGSVITVLTDRLPSPERWAEEDLRKAIATEFGAATHDFLNKLPRSDEGGLKGLASYGLSQGRSAYGVTACQKLAQWLAKQSETADASDKDVSEDQAVEAVFGAQISATPVVTGKLADPGTLVVTSPVVRRALVESHKFLQSFFRRHGTPSSVVIELMREMRKSLEKRKEISLSQRTREMAKSRAKKQLVENGFAQSDTNVRRYLLWLEQNEHCPYSGQRIGLSDALDGAKTNFEHVLPRSLRGVGNRAEGLVLARVDFNAMKDDETPWGAANSPENKAKWDWNATLGACRAIAKAKPAFKRKAALITNQVFAADVAEDLKEFLDRQFTDTAWIGREVHRWMRSVTSDVTVIRGQLTSTQRTQWGLHTVLEQLRQAEGKHTSKKSEELFFGKQDTPRFDKRCDHRHHMVDAAVIGLTTRAAYRAEIKRRAEWVPGSRAATTDLGCPVPNLRDALIERLNGYIVWQKPNRLVTGKMFDEEPFSLLVDNKLIKRGDVAKRSFRAQYDKVVQHRDRQNITHTKAVVSAQFACLALEADDWRLITLAEFVAKQYVIGHKLTRHAGERLFFKGDLLYSPREGKFYTIEQLSDGKGLCCIEANETSTFDKLKGTGLGKSFGTTAAIEKLIVFPTKNDLGSFLSRQRDAQ